MASDSAIKALLQLRKGSDSRVGADRIRLLEVIGERGSISAAARELGLSYKGAWDAVQALNNLFERPLVSAQTGGRAGGAATITPAGRAVVAAFRKVEADLSGVVEQLEAYLSDDGSPFQQVLRSLTMKTSARNVLRGVVSAVTPGQVNSEVTLAISDGIRIVAIITKESVDDLGLVPGREAMALIKSSFVILAAGGSVVRRGVAAGGTLLRDGDLAPEAAVPWRHPVERLHVAGPEVAQDLERVEARDVGREADADAGRAVDEHHGDDGHVELGLDRDAVVLEVRQDRTVLGPEDELGDGHGPRANVPIRGVAP